MKWNECKKLIALDYSNTGGQRNLLRFFLSVLRNDSFMLIFWFRIGSFLKDKTGLYHLLYFVVKQIYRHYQFKTGRQLPIGTSVKGGLRFVHWGTVVISVHAIIGENCTILHGVTIGKTHKGTPIIGNNVTIGAHSLVIGPVRIGDNVCIGAGSVVVHDVSCGGVVVGNPASLISNRGDIERKGY